MSASAVPPGTPAAAPRLPLFPLQTVLFPGGLLDLRVFEARYLDLVSLCLRQGTPFGVVCQLQGSELRGASGEKARFEVVGVLAQLIEVDAEQPGILQVRCRGGRRFSLEAPAQQDDGLWTAETSNWPDEDRVPVPADLLATRDALTRAIESMDVQGQQPFAKPYQLEDAGWVANRWCELLPVSLAAKHKLMALDEPALRLKLVDEFLRSKGVV